VIAVDNERYTPPKTAVRTYFNYVIYSLPRAYRAIVVAVGMFSYLDTHYLHAIVDIVKIGCQLSLDTFVHP